MSLQQTAFLLRANVPELATLQTAIDALGFDCKLDKSYVPFQNSSHLPCVLGGSKSGFEIVFESTQDVLADFQHLTPAVGNRDVAITFRWGTDMSECACVLIVSAALAHSFDAIVHYQDDDMLCTAKQLAEAARMAIHSQ